MELFEVDQGVGDACIEVLNSAFHLVNTEHCFLCHVCEPLQTFLDGRKAQNVEVMEYLSVDLGFFENRVRYFAILSRGALD